MTSPIIFTYPSWPQHRRDQGSPHHELPIDDITYHFHLSFLAPVRYAQYRTFPYRRDQRSPDHELRIDDLTYHFDLSFLAPVP